MCSITTQVTNNYITTFLSLRSFLAYNHFCFHLWPCLIMPTLSTCFIFGLRVCVIFPHNLHMCCMYCSLQVYEFMLTMTLQLQKCWCNNAPSWLRRSHHQDWQASAIHFSYLRYVNFYPLQTFLQLLNIKQQIKLVILVLFWIWPLLIRKKKNIVWL